MKIRKLVHRPIFIALALCLFAFPVFGATPAEYRSRLESARANVGELLGYVAETEIGTKYVVYEANLLREIREKVPPTEKIEWPEGSLDTSNQSLIAKLDEFENESDTTKQAVILTEIDERLAAIVEKIAELETAITADRSKDEDIQKLAEILRREEFQKPEEAKQSALQKWLNDLINWFMDLFPKSEPAAPNLGGMPSLANALLVLLGILALGLVGFAIYKFAPFFSLRSRTKNKKQKKDRVILGERIGAEESAEDLFGEAERLAREGNLRGAIRKGYIAVLCDLSDRKLIGLANHKTNRDYLRDVRSRRELFENMHGLTNSFERHWYGFQTAETADWEEFRERSRRAVVKT
ncbi:MAG: DUF4129 domain-containing protein [Pyrinomonadaceae bacterium]